MSRHRREQESSDDSAAFAVECPGCRAHVSVTGRLVGRPAGCPRCRAAFLVPRPDREERRPSRPDADDPRAAPAVTAPSPSDSTPTEPARPEPTSPSRSVAGPIAWSDPPVPSTRRRRDDALATIPEAVSTAGTAAGPTAPAVTVPDATTTTTATASAGDTDVPGGLALEEPVKIIRSGGAEIELRRLTPEERRARRARRNLIILVVGASLLVALVVILGKGGR